MTSPAPDRRSLRSILGPGPEVPWNGREAVALVLAVHLVLIVAGGIVVGSVAEGETIPMPKQFLATVPFWIAAIAGALWLARRDGDDPKRVLGLSIRPVDVPIGVAVGVLMQLVVIPFLYELFGADLDELERPARELADNARGGVATVLFVVMTCVCAPFAEELLYRIVLQRGVGRSSALAGLLVAAVVFGAAHFQPMQFAGLALFGAASGFVVWRSDRLGPGVIAHVAFNASTVVILLRDR